MRISVPTESVALVPFRAEVQRRLYPHVKNADESNGNRLEQVLQVCLIVCGKRECREPGADDVPAFDSSSNFPLPKPS